MSYWEQKLPRSLMNWYCTNHFIEIVLDKFCKGNNSNMKTPMDMSVYKSKN
jgi:hypothetical protein